MRLIDADALHILFVKKKDFGELSAKKAIRCVEEAPTVDAIPVIRCKDCEWYGIEQLKQDGMVDRRYKPSRCFLWHEDMDEKDFCSYGRRITDE